MQVKVLAGVAALAVGGGAAVALAQDAAPTIAITAGGGAAKIVGAEAVRSGPARLELSSGGRRERFLAIFEAKPGVTEDEFEGVAAQNGPPSSVESLGRIVAGGAAPPGKERYATTIPVRERDYYVVDLTGERPSVRGSFRPGAGSSTAVKPRPDSRINMRDLRFTGNDTLPRKGIVQIANRGEQVHHIVAFRLRKGYSSERAVRLARQGKEFPVSAPPQELVGAVSGGTVNSVEVNLKEGRWVLMCFMPDERSDQGTPHAAEGMVRLVKVR